MKNRKISINGTRKGAFIINKNINKILLKKVAKYQSAYYLCETKAKQMNTAYSTFYGETLIVSDFSSWTASQIEREYYGLKAENDMEACAFFHALGAAKGITIDGGYDFGQDKQDLQNMHKSNVAACMGKI